MYSDVIDEDANGKDSKYASDGIKASIRKIIYTFAIHYILPKPLSHGIAVGMNHQHTECARRYGIDPFVMLHLQILEIHECEMEVTTAKKVLESVTGRYAQICLPR